MTSDKSISEPCPLGTRWAEWKIYVFLKRAGGKHLTPNEHAAILRARRRRVAWKPAAPLSVEWSVGPGDATQLKKKAGLLSHRLHQHASAVINKRSIHIDWATGRAEGPVSGYYLVRIYVDGALVDEAVHGAVLGCTVMGGQALAVISRGLAVGVAPGWPGYCSSVDGPPPIWLMKPDRGQ